MSITRYFLIFAAVAFVLSRVKTLELESSLKEARAQVALYQKDSLQHLKDSEESLQLGNTAWEIHLQKMKEVNAGLQILCEDDTPSPAKLRKACLAWSAARTP